MKRVALWNLESALSVSNDSSRGPRGGDAFEADGQYVDQWLSREVAVF